MSSPLTPSPAPPADPYGSKARDEAFRTAYGQTPEDKKRAREERSRAKVPRPRSWDELVLTHDNQLITPDGVVRLELLGKGYFTKAYIEKLEDDRPGQVYLFTHPYANDKAAMAQAHAALPNNPHLPAIEAVGRLNDYRAVFKLPHYRVPFHLSDATPEDAKAYQLLRRCFSKTRGAPSDSGYDRSLAKIICAEDAGLPVEMQEALDRMLTETRRFGTSFDLEISPRNVATDAQGRLVLLDLFFDSELARRMKNPLPSRPASSHELPRSWNDLVLTRDSRLITPKGIIPLEKIGKGLFSVVYREKERAGRVFAMTHKDSFDKEVAAAAHDGYPDNPHLPAVEQLGMLTDERRVYVMPHYATPFRMGNANKASAKAYTELRKCIVNHLGFQGDSLYEKNLQKLECAKEANVEPAVLEALEALISTSADYGSDEFAIEFSPRNTATDANGNLVLLDLFYNQVLTRQLHKEKQKRPSYRNNPLPPRQGASSGLRPGERELAVLFLVEPLRGYVSSYFFARMPVFGAEIEPEGDHYKLKTGHEQEFLERLAAEQRLEELDPRRLVVFGLYDRLSREEAAQQVHTILSSRQLAHHVYLIVAEMRHRLTLDPLRLKEAGLSSRATFDDALRAGLGPYAVRQDVLYDTKIVRARLSHLCDDIADHDENGEAVIDVVSGASDDEARLKAQQKAKELHYDLKYAAQAKGDLQAVRVKATRYSAYRPHMCDPSWA